MRGKMWKLRHSLSPPSPATILPAVSSNVRFRKEISKF